MGITTTLCKYQSNFDLIHKRLQPGHCALEHFCMIDSDFTMLFVFCTVKWSARERVFVSMLCIVKNERSDVQALNQEVQNHTQINPPRLGINIDAKI